MTAAAGTARSVVGGAPRKSKRKGPLQQVADLAAKSGIIHKGGLALAAGGLALTVAFPATSGPLAGAGVKDQGQDTASISASAAQAPVTASASARISFSRTSSATIKDPDARLKELMIAQSGTVTPAAAKGTLGWPLATLTQASPFGWRINPLGGPSDFHRGEDLVAQCGSSVMAAAAGKVVFVGWDNTGGGNRVVVDHGNGLETTYNHLSSFSVQQGQTVQRGDQVALSGTTGASTGCHLHFEVMVNGQVVDPAGWL
ncbi:MULTISPECIES: M23 family metallopeptidase [Arthrobacter]|uniref:M23 family metallopeptidase n=2 Tax=Arthrobacter TaxID=1663 RepID=A0ABU9KLH3_9MICC|nr:M23 family metallopeptidase [Arthrobacter sp. YJM1]MDP5227754.1 M23 family metallopeptidase [Arthrobacter sp. YJM1]